MRQFSNNNTLTKSEVEKQKLINYWFKNAEERKASLEALLPDHRKQSYLMIRWYKIIRRMTEAKTLGVAYRGFLSFHELVDVSLRYLDPGSFFTKDKPEASVKSVIDFDKMAEAQKVVGDFQGIWDKFRKSATKKNVEKRFLEEKGNRQKGYNYQLNRDQKGGPPRGVLSSITKK